MEKLITREELYKIVWQTPIAKIAIDLQIGVSALREKCHDNKIPLPPNGYWSKLKYGKKVNKIPLPQLEEDKPINLHFDDSINIDDYSVPFNLRLNHIKKKIQSDKSLPLEIPKSLRNPDELVESTIEYYRNLELNKSNWNVRPEKGVININVSKGNMKRALIIMDYFIKLVKARGYDVKYEYGSAQVLMHTTTEEFGIREKYNVTKLDKYPYEKREATGILVFKAKCCYHKTWEDSKSKSLEEKIPSIVAWFEATARDTKAHWDENARRRKMDEERAKKEKEIMERKEKEIKNFNSLLDEAERWHKANILREYIKYHETNNLYIHYNLHDWLKWANNKADWYDPLIKKEDDILGYYNEEESD